MAKLNIRIHECGSSASSLGPSPMGVLRVGRPRKDMLATKKNESAAITEDAVLALLDELNLVVDNKWFDGDNTIPVFDCRDTHDDSGELVSVRVEPPYEARVWYTDRNPRNNGFTEGIESIEDLKSTLAKFFDLELSESKKNESGEDAQAVLQAKYGDGDTYYGESSANGFYATERHPMAWAILNNDVAELEALHNGTMKTPKEPWNCHGWSEDIDAPEDSEGNYPYVYNMDTDYEETFVEDMPDRVVGETDNQDALRKALEYYPDFVLPFVDFWNAFHKGYDKDLLLSFLYNARNLYNDMQVDIQGYLDYDEFGKDAYNNLESFLEGK